MAKKKILIVDDEEILTRTFVNMLEKSGYETYTARNGLDAEIIATEESFGLIICDIRMPGINGVETVQRIRKISKNPDFKIIFVTGYADTNTEKKAKEFNPAGYFHKPFDIQEILLAVKKSMPEA
ncbi:MAG: hypothetical protein A2Z83_08350 [Omnitrophica bacterium GWA2_52_8]|nr:MAG: hypothetical protein A2Z83_08350 [Omnitrophica bacterium GWA2_52_8]